VDEIEEDLDKLIHNLHVRQVVERVRPDLSLLRDVRASHSERKEDPPMKPMIEYVYNSSTRDDPRWYENQPHQHDVSTATTWALHLHVKGESDRDLILDRMAALLEATGEYTYGDSWRQWGEPAEGDDDLHMVVYFTARPDDAARVGGHLATHATFAARSSTMLSFAVSTSGDYAEVVL
jgi:hypothetical protein